MAKTKKKVDVGIIMGSKSDWPTMEAAAKVLDELGIAYEAEIISAHRTPDRTLQYAESAKARGLRVIIAGAGGAAHLAGFVAAKTTLPVLGVPMKSSALNGLDSLLSIVQMPAGIPVATFAIGRRARRMQAFLPRRFWRWRTRGSNNRWISFAARRQRRS